MTNKMRRSDFLFYVLIAYIFSAGGWWSYLLYSKNKETLEARTIALRYALKERGIQSESDFQSAEQYKDLQKYYQRKQLMIYGEGVTLFVLLVVGVWYTHRSRKKELVLAQQQRNFLLSITHELKSPLASVQLGLETLQRRQLTPEQTQKIANHALRDTERLHQLIQNLLLATRVESGYVYHFININIIDLIKKSIEQVQPLFRKPIVLETKLMEVQVPADEMTLYGVFINLLENAIKYAPESPQITVAIGLQGQQVCVEVRDCGKGIPKSEKELIFNKFYRMGNEETRTSKGTGLGLYIVKQVVEAHGGKISIKDNSPHGAIFQVLINTK